jgi:DNA-binding NtrC family response regulator
VPEVRRSRVLIVDDEDAIRELLTDYLVTAGYDVCGAGTAIAGFAVARERQPDVILLDLNLPGAVSGADVVEAFAREWAVVVISGTRDIDLARVALKAGAFDYITKPFDLRRVAAVVAAAVVHRHGPV